MEVRASRTPVGGDAATGRTDPGPAVGTRVVSPTLVGRAAELSRVVTALSAAPAVVVVEGEAGVGKTRLVSALPSCPDLATRRFAAGWCRRVREPLPLGPVLDAVRVLGGAITAAATGAPLSPVTGALRPLLPEIADLLPPRPDALDDRAAERHRVFRALVEVLGSVGPTVLVLEDLHWADEQTVDFVSYLLGAPPSTLSLVVTFRGEDVSAEVRELTTRLPAPVSLAQVALGPLDAAGTGALAAAILGAPRVPGELGTLLHQRTSGLPFAVEELVALLRERGVLVCRGGRWGTSPPLTGAVAELDVPAGVRDPVLARLGRLSEPGRSVVRAASVFPEPVRLPLLVTVGQVAEAAVPCAVEEALGSGLLVERDQAVGFRHQLAAQAVYESMHAWRRQALHDRAASALEAARPVQLGQLAHHLRHAGRLAAWVDVAERAADRAVEVGHEEEAARLLEDLLRHAPLEAAQQGRIAVKLGRAAVDTVHAPWRVTDLLTRVLERDLPPGVRGELQFWLATLTGHTGTDPCGWGPMLASAIEELDGEPDLKAWGLATMGIRAIAQAPSEDPRAWLDRAMEIIPRIDNRVLEVFLLGKVAATLAITGDPEWPALARRIEQRTAGSPRQRREVQAYYTVGAAACVAGHHEIADRMLARGLAGVVGCEDPRLELLLRSATTVLDYLQGSWQGLRDTAERLVEEADDYLQARVDADLVAGGLALAEGDFDHAELRLSDALAGADTLGDLLFLPLGVSAATQLALARGDVRSAMAHGDRLLAAVQDGVIWAPFARVLPGLTQTMVATGRTGAARKVVRRWARELAGRDAPLAPAALPHARGFLDVAGQRWLAAARHFRAAAGGYESVRCPYDAAQAREQAALCLFEAGASGADLELRAAMAGYQRLGATWDLDRARSVARRHGVPAPNRHRSGRRGYGDHLSPREREVVELAALGRTNKEIAGELFLSPHTVDKHLRSALRKLGLRSRTVLAHKLGAAGAERVFNGGSSP